MSFIARYNDWFLGGLIGHPDLTAAQWTVIRSAAQHRYGGGVRSRMTFFLLAILGYGLVTFWLDVLMQLQWFNISISASSLMRFCIMALYVFAVMELRVRWVLSKHIRAAANDLGLVRVCLTCGYDLKGSAGGDADVCPECGTTPARKPESTG